MVNNFKSYNQSFYLEKLLGQLGTGNFIGD
jgi:hypothetical protein